ncbi:MAG: ketoacyl-ACP synthase III [Chloroflexi bacterium]|nr:MAG: ketoacyl-ACP synthase III [Chloroflexota bacterium]
MRYAHIVGWGKYVPENVVTNEDLARIVDTSDEWIRTRTGITERRIAEKTEATSDMAIKAARAALEVANFDPAQLDLIIVSTCTPDHPLPSTACLVQTALGASQAAAFDLNAACSGFIYGLNVATSMIRGGGYDNILLIGAEMLTRWLDWEDRATCVLFGDGAGAFLLQASDQPGGIMSFALGADGSGADLLIVPGGGTRNPPSWDSTRNGMCTLKMEGREVFRFATRVMGRVAKEAVERAGLEIDDIELFIPHQANLRIIKRAARYLDLPMERVFVNVNRYGNTSSASVPIAVCEAVDEGRLRPGDHVVLVGFGAGLTWGAAVVQWAFEPQEWPVWRRSLQWTRYRLAGAKALINRTERKLGVLEERLLRRNGYGNGHHNGSNGRPKTG